MTFFYKLKDIIFKILNFFEKQNKIKELLKIFIFVFIAIALCTIIFLKLRPIIFLHDDNIKTFYALKYSFEFYKNVMQRPWKPRLFSCALAALFMPDDQIKNWVLISPDDLRIEIKDYELFYIRVGVWTVFWIFLTFIIFIFLRKNFSLFYMFGIFACLGIYFVPTEYARVYPWDMPMLFFYSLVVFLTAKDLYKWLVIILPIATGFKETAMVLPFIFFVWNKVPFKTRFIYASVTFLLCAIVKIYLSLITQNSSLFFTMDIEPNIHKSFFLIFSENFYNVLFINAGTLFPFLILPTKDSYINFLKLISIIFLGCMFVFGHYHEYRIFIELAPFALYSFDKVLNNVKRSD